MRIPSKASAGPPRISNVHIPHVRKVARITVVFFTLQTSSKFRIEGKRYGENMANLILEIKLTAILHDDKRTNLFIYLFIC